MQKYEFQVGSDWQYISECSDNAIKSQHAASIELPKEIHIGRPFKNYMISLEAAKALSLIENSSESYKIWKNLIQQEQVFINAIETSAKINYNEYYIRITTSQAQKLKELVNECSRKTQQHHQTIWTQFQHQFMVNSYLELPAEKFEQACSYLNAVLESNADKEFSLENKVTPLEKEMQEKILSIANNVIQAVGDALRKAS